MKGGSAAEGRCKYALGYIETNLTLTDSFAGLTAAYHLKRKPGDLHQIKIIDKYDRFVFIPALIWVPRVGERRSKSLLRYAIAGCQRDWVLQTSVERGDAELQFVDTCVNRAKPFGVSLTTFS